MKLPICTKIFLKTGSKELVAPIKKANKKLISHGTTYGRGSIVTTIKRCLLSKTNTHSLLMARSISIARILSASSATSTKCESYSYGL